GKSGTAQIISYDLRNRLGKEKQFKDNSWFVGYAPHRNPEIVVSVIVQGGGHGSEAAGPVVRDVVKAYYDKKNKDIEGATTAEAAPIEPSRVAAEHAASVQAVARREKLPRQPSEEVETVPSSARNDPTDQAPPQPQQRRIGVVLILVLGIGFVAVEEGPGKPRLQWWRLAS